MTSPHWHSKTLILSIILATLILGSWLIDSPLRAAWDMFDAQVFYTLNGSLPDSPNAAILWAALNNRLFDIAAGSLFFILFIHYIRSAKPEEFFTRACQFAMVALYILFISQLERVVFFNITRISPSLVLEPSYRLSELVPWLPTKDSSGNSFPGDHGMVALMLMAFLWYLGGVRYGILAIIVTVISLTPRLVSGAHWATDIVVGSVSVTLFSVAVAIATPLYTRLTHSLERLIRKYMPWVEALVKTVLCYKK